MSPSLGNLPRAALDRTPASGAGQFLVGLLMGICLGVIGTLALLAKGVI